MFREPLRSRTGCDSCRKRHKKCDETKPVCNNCSRLNLSCTSFKAKGLPESSTNTSTSTSVVPLQTQDANWLKIVDIKRVPRLVRRNALGQGYQQFRDQVQFDLTAWSPKTLQGFVSQSAAPEFSDTSILMTVALHHPWIRDALAAFSAYSLLTLSRGNTRWEELAIVMYQRAVSAVRKHITATWDGSHSLETLVAVTFLGLSESLGTGAAAQAITHFSAAAAICKTVSLASMGSPDRCRLYRMLVECWLFNLATLALFHTDCASITRCIDWSVLDSCFLAFAGPNGLALHESPFISGSHGIYKLMLQMTCFARIPTPPSTRRAQSLQWSVELDDIEKRLSHYFVVLPEDVALLYHSRFLLHIYALRIFSAKISNHRLAASSPIVLSHIKAAQRLVQPQTTRESRYPTIVWPLVICLCATDDDSSFDFFVTTINDIHENFDIGHARRIHMTLRIIKEQRKKSRSGIDLLLCERGISSEDCTVLVDDLGECEDSVSLENAMGAQTDSSSQSATSVEQGVER